MEAAVILGTLGTLMIAYTLIDRKMR